MFIALAELNGSDEIISQAERLLAGAGPVVFAALQTLNRISTGVHERLPGLPIHFDLAELRGYRYHTGLVFAAYVPGQGQEIARGGRYDKIGQAFGLARPATGFSADLKTLHALGNR